MARLLKIENWARTYSFGPRKINFTSKSAEFNCEFNRLVYGGPRSTDQRKKNVFHIFSCYQVFFFCQIHTGGFEFQLELVVLASTCVFFCQIHTGGFEFQLELVVLATTCVFSVKLHTFQSERERKKILRFEIHLWLVISHFGFWLFSVVRKYIFFFGQKYRARAQSGVSQFKLS